MKRDTMDPVPLYAQVAEDLRSKILSGTWSPGDRIPPELTLCDVYHVSRVTVRKGIEQLARERLIIRKRARGTFVRDWSVEDRSEHFTAAKSFTDEMRELGKTALTLWADVSIEPADAHTAKLLDCPVGAAALKLRRTRGAEGRPFVYFVTSIRYREGLPRESEAYYGSLSSLLRGLGIIVNQGHECIEAITAPSEVCEMLHISRNQPVLKRTRMLGQREGDYREHTECFYSGAEYKYYIDLG